MTKIRSVGLYAVVDETGATCPLYIGGDPDSLSVFLTRKQGEHYKNEYQHLFPEHTFEVQEYSVLPEKPNKGGEHHEES